MSDELHGDESHGEALPGTSGAAIGMSFGAVAAERPALLPSIEPPSQESLSQESLPAAAKGARGVRFQVLDSDEVRKDLERRREIKFTFQSVDVGHLRGVLQSLLRRQIHADQVSTVRSLYYDGPRFPACRANLDGIGERRKLRLRWYDSLLPGNDFQLELKWRSNRITGKHRLKLHSDVPLSQLSFAAIRDELQRVVPDGFHPALARYSEPVVIVEYRREHFVSGDRSIRMTLDYDIRFYDQLGRSAPFLRFPVASDNLVVLEGKTPVGGESRLRELLEPLAPRAHRCSKYVHGCHLIGAVPAVD